jgi:hypothetical protein
MPSPYRLSSDGDGAGAAEEPSAALRRRILGAGDHAGGLTDELLPEVAKFRGVSGTGYEIPKLRAARYDLQRAAMGVTTTFKYDITGTVTETSDSVTTVGIDPSAGANHAAPEEGHAQR